MAVAASLKERAAALPDASGVYLFRTASERVLYVGKATSLRKRVAQYLGGHDSRPMVPELIATATSVDYVLAQGDVECLSLEISLIKHHRPPFNARMSDDKHYPYIKLSNDPIPRISKVRRIHADGARYFGPFPNEADPNRLIKATRRIFGIRDCRTLLPMACLAYHIGLCCAPCLDPTGYGAKVKEADLFLSGRHSDLTGQLRAQMVDASDSQRYEEAARLRDQLRAVGKAASRQRVIGSALDDIDVLTVVRDARTTLVVLLPFRGGRLVGRTHYVLEAAAGEEDGALLQAFIQQYYSDSPIPQELVVAALPPDHQLLSRWLGHRRAAMGGSGASVPITLPRRGRKREQVALAEENASALLQSEARAAARGKGSGVSELGRVLQLAQPPLIIEGFDVSHTQGVEVVASMVRFADGRPDKGGYRKFTITTVEGQDDVASMREVVHRRYHRLQQEGALMPDLVLIDGGPTQLGAAIAALSELGLTLQVAALAKRQEEVYLPSRLRPVLLPRDSPALHLLQRVRDEAHRFAIGFHRTRRAKRALGSALDSIPGVGDSKRRALLQHFGSVEAIRKASLEELQLVDGVGPALAARINASLR